MPVCVMIILFALTGRCRALSIGCENLGSLLRNSMLPRVRSTLLGCVLCLLFMTVVTSVARRGLWNGVVCETLLLFSSFVSDRTTEALSVLVGASLGTNLGRCVVSTDPFVLGGLITSRRRWFVVVTLSVCPVCLRFPMLVTLVVGCGCVSRFVCVGLSGD